MDLFSIFFLSCALATDAFAVALCKGFSTTVLLPRHYFLTALFFGGAGVMMPVLGYFVGVYFISFIASIDHWIAFFLLLFLGLRMLRQARRAGAAGCERAACCPCGDFSPRSMLGLALATSIDALAVGISFAFLGVEIFSSAVLIGVVTIIFCLAALRIGHNFGLRYRARAEFLGGLVLVLIGLKILITDLFF